MDPFVGSGRCKTGEIYTNRLICEPPIKKPESEDKDPRVTVTISLYLRNEECTHIHMSIFMYEYI